MGAELWTAVGSVAGVFAAGLVAWQVRLQLAERHRGPGVREHASAVPVTGGLSVAVPLGRLPPEVRGRDSLLGELRRALTRRLRRQGSAWVLAGMGGLGKSTVALAAAEFARSRGWRVWWVTATDAASLAGGMLEVLRQLGAPDFVCQPVREGVPQAADVAWEFLNGPNIAGRRWLLVLDNADSPTVLAGGPAGIPGDYTGWLRPDPVGVVLVTTRVKDQRVWGRRVILRELVPLDDQMAARVLCDLAPAAAGPDRTAASRLGRRLGGLPLALQLAGSYLASPFARWHSFADYHRALDGVDLPAALADLDESGTDNRAAIQRTWDLSLDALAAGGEPQARPLLMLLSCYEPATPIPASLLQQGSLSRLPGYDGLAATGDPARTGDRRFRAALRALAAVGLIDLADGSSVPAVTVHPVIADANRARMVTTMRSDLGGIGNSAVHAVLTATGNLHDHLPADWPAWRGLIPHIGALLRWLASVVNPDVLADLLSVSNPAADALWQAGDRPAAEELARLSVAAAARLGSKHPASLAARRSLTAIIAERGLYAEAEQSCRELLTDEQQILGPDHLGSLKTRAELAWAVRKQGRFGEAEELYRDLLADQQQRLGRDHPDTLDARINLARIAGLKGHYRDAEQQYRDVLADIERVYHADHPRILNARYALALPIRLQGRYPEAEQLCRQVLADRQRVLGPDHPDTLQTSHRLARTLARQDKHQEAERICRDVLAGQQRIIGPGHPKTLATRGTLAWVIGSQGRHGEAERLCKRLIADQAAVVGNDHPQNLQTRHTQAWLAAEQGRYRDAEEFCRSVLDDRQRILGEDHPDALLSLQLLASLTLRRGDAERAEQMYRQTLAAQRRILGDDHPDTQATASEISATFPALSSRGPS